MEPVVTLYEEFDKTKIAALPQVQFSGRIVVVTTIGSVHRAIDFLSRQPILGIDTETRPSFKKGTNHKVSLLQLATRDMCFLFRLNKIGLPDKLLELLADKRQLKVGLSLKDDRHMLHERASFDEGRFIDLQDYVRQFGIVDMSLQKLFANVFGLRISKGAQLSNWEAPVLTERQKRYAATDAWACVLLYQRLEELRHTGDYRLISRVSMDHMQEQVVKDLVNQLAWSRKDNN